MTRKLKIGLVCPYNITISGGVQLIVMSLADRLSEKGHQVKIITPLPKGHQLTDFHDSRIIFIGKSTDFRSPLHTTVQISTSIYNDRIKQVLTNEKFDVINLHEPWVPFISRQILQKSQAINIGTFHAKIPESVMTRSLVRVVNPYLKSVIEELDGITACSASAAEYVGSLTTKTIKIIPNGIDLSLFKIRKNTTINTKHPTILYIGRLETRKGVGYLIEAFRFLYDKYPKVKLLIAGDGPNRSKLEELVKKYRLNSNVKFLGVISDNQKYNLLNKCDLFCSPAIFGESFGIVLLEAMAASAVVVAGNNSGYSELMQGIGKISIVNVKDICSFTDRLEILLFQPELRQVWLNWAKQYSKEYDINEVVIQYESYYLDTLLNG